MRVRSLLVVMVTTCMVTLTVLAASPVASAAEPSTLTHACASKSSGQLRHTATPTGCSKQETLVTFSVASPTVLCATSSGAVHVTAKANSCAKQLKGTTMTVPTSTPAFFCAQPSAALRLVPALSQCSASDLQLVSRNNAPTGLALSPSSVAENVPIGTVVGIVRATDTDPGDSLQFSLAAGAGSEDNMSFTLSGTTLRTAAAVDFESQSSYSIRLLATDAGGLTQAAVVTIAVTDVAENDPPTGLSLSNNEVAENAATVVGTLSTTDADPDDTFTYTLTSDGSPNDNALFSISGDTLSTTGLDHEGVGPDYVVTVQTDDGHGGTLVANISVDAQNVNEAPSSISVDPSVVDENVDGATVGALSASDPDAGDSLSFSLVSGSGDTDNGAFEVVGTDLVTRSGLDFEHGPYSVRVAATDMGGLSAVQALTVFVNDLNDAPTGISLTPKVVMENQPAGTTVGTLSAEDQDAGDSVTFSLTGGDTARFAVVGDELRTTQPLDHEAAGTRTVTVTADDGRGGTVSDDVTVTITNLNESPSAVSLSSSTVAENQPGGTPVGTVSSLDPDGSEPHAYSLVAGTGDDGNASFDIDGDQLLASDSFDFEATDSFSIRVRATDTAGGSTDQVFVISVTNVNEAPETLTLNGSDIPENRPAGTSIGTLSSEDPDDGDTATYSLPAGSADNAAFTLTGSVLKSGAIFDFEDRATYSVLVRVSDGSGLTRQETFTISVTDGNDAPTAVADSYTGAVGNTRAALGTTSSGARVVLSGDLPVANDTDPEGDELTAEPGTHPTTSGGSAVVNVDGSFVYTPGVGDRSQTDTFTYEVTDGEFTSSATISITIGSALVWYVDNTATAAGDGRSHSPFTTTSQVSGSGDPDGTGDILFLHGSATAYERLTLEAGQQLRGQPAGLTVSGSQILAPSGVNPVVSAVGGTALQVAAGTDVQRVDVSASGSGSIGVLSFGGDLTIGSNMRISASGATSRALVVQPSTPGTATIQAAIEGTDGSAVQIIGSTAVETVNVSGPVVGTNASIEVQSTHLSTVANFTGGIALANTDRAGLSIQQAGTVTVTGAGNVVRTTTGQAVNVANSRIGASGITLQRVDADGGTQPAVRLNNTGTDGSFVVTGNSSGHCGGNVGADGSLIATADGADCTGGTLANQAQYAYELVNTLNPQLTRVHILNSTSGAIRATGAGGFTLLSSWIKNAGASNAPSVDLGAFQGDFSGVVTVRDNTLETSRFNAFSLRSNAPTTATMTGNQIIGSDRFGMYLVSRGASTYTADVLGNYFVGNVGSVVGGPDPVGTGGEMRVRVASNTMGTPSALNVFAPAISFISNPSSISGSSWSGLLRYDIEDNRVRGSSQGGGINVGSGSSSAAGTVVGLVRNNVIGVVGESESCGSSGVTVYASAGVNTALVSGNQINRCRSQAINLRQQSGITTADVTIVNNQVGPMTDPFANYGLLLIAENAGTTPGCYDIRGNQLQHGTFGGTTVDASLRTTGTTPIRIPGYAGAPTSTSAISSYVGSLNNAASVETILSSGGNVTGGGACVQPSP